MPTTPHISSCSPRRRAYARITASTAKACFRRDSVFVYWQRRFQASSLECIGNEDTGSRKRRQGWGGGAGNWGLGIGWGLGISHLRFPIVEILIVNWKSIIGNPLLPTPDPQIPAPN